MTLAPSKQFIRAAQSERKALVRAYQRQLAEGDRLQAQVEQTARSMDAIQQRLQALGALLGDPDFAILPAKRADAEPVAIRATQDREASPHVLAGPKVRGTAVRVLLDQPEPFKPLHYRRWYDLVVAAGYAVAGKTPEAVFLTQIGRSPMVCKAPDTGIYVLDRDASSRIRETLGHLQANLRDFSTQAGGDVDSFTRAASRRQLVADINRAERSLAEVTDLLPGGVVLAHTRVA
jgi:hypothetical protein